MRGRWALSNVTERIAQRRQLLDLAVNLVDFLMQGNARDIWRTILVKSPTAHREAETAKAHRG